MAAWPVARGNKISMCAPSRPDKQVKNSSEEIPHCLSFQKSQCLNFLRAFFFALLFSRMPQYIAYCLCLLLCTIEAGDLLDSVKRRFFSHH